MMKVSFILVSPKYPENVGAAARALKAMGFDDLRLVKPCDHLSERAHWLAHASKDILESAGVFESLPAAGHNLDFLIAASARSRKKAISTCPVDQLPALLKQKRTLVRSVGMVFGPEDNGLSNRDLDHCDMMATIPMEKRFPSLNLAQAVMVFAYTLSGLTLPVSRDSKKTSEALPGFKQCKGALTASLASMGIPPGHNIHKRILSKMSEADEETLKLIRYVTKRWWENFPGSS